ncbi:uncharacterized protein LTR77_004894 [Saxophila tyrrhenica]|uniref:Uncharacterized protein n=1 Tax=Saxophila tyrrhenica TaxID=1690608 RepID=A0AAV9PAD2_9PEZI|nr:hypothetical protein LTR77_004894 [Saxophila tyrrhenica]
MSYHIAGNEYNSAPAHHHQAPAPSGQPDITSPSSTTSPRYASNFYPTYPQQPMSAGPGTMPSVHDAMNSMHPQASSTLATSSSSAAKDEEEVEAAASRKRKLFGDIPDAKKRKFIIVEDAQRGQRVRVRVTLDQVNMQDMPDAHLKINAVYPRSYYPRQSGESATGPKIPDWDDEDDGEPGAKRGTTMVKIPLMEGEETRMPVPKMTRARRGKEMALNELGARMSWQQARTFHNRPLFLQKSLDAHRTKVREAMMGADEPGGSTDAGHFETRPGKRKWLARKRPVMREAQDGQEEA